MGTACSGNDDGKPVGPEGNITALTLTLLEDTIEADGVTPLKYKVEDQDGNDVTDWRQAPYAECVGKRCDHRYPRYVR